MYGNATRETTFDDFFFTYAKGLVLYAKRFVGSEEEAKDIVHDVFVSFWEKMGVISDDNIKSYLFVSTRNRCLDRLSKLKKGDAYREKIIGENKYLEYNLDLFVETEAMQQIRRAIDKLPPQRKKVFTMSKIEGKTFAMIAEELQISPKTVDKHLEMAVRFLRKELSGVALTFFLAFFLLDQS